MFMKYLMSPEKNIEALETYIAFLVSKKKKATVVGIVVPPPPSPPALAKIVKNMRYMDPI
jgi:hypothetical protein